MIMKILINKRQYNILKESKDQFCNLSEVVARNTDTYLDLERKVKIAAILGTWQSTLTRFRYINKDWKKNCEEERLLGVSMTGMMDCPLINRVTKDSVEVVIVD